MSQLPSDLVTPRTAATLVGVSTHTVYRWIRLGTLKGYLHFGTRFYVSRQDVEAMATLVPVEPANVPPWRR